MQNILLHFDTWGVVRKLILNEGFPMGTHSPEGLLRMLGWVHLYTSSGIHIYAFLEWSEVLIKRLGKVEWLGRRVPILAIKVMLQFFVLTTLIVLWKLQGFRFGFLRPMLAFGLRQIATRLGLKFEFLVPLILVAALDFALGNEFSGRLHYYLAVGGGIVTMLVLKKYNAHATLAFGSWIWIAVYELLFDHRIAIFTPLWSLITLPILCMMIYPSLILMLLGSLFVPIPIFTKIFQFTVQLANHFLTFSIKLMDYFDLTFFVVDEKLILISALIALLLTLFWLSDVEFKKHIFIAALFTVCLIRLYAEVKPKHFEPKQEKVVTQIDVGQGDALLVHSDVRSEMIDVGSGRSVKPEKFIAELARNNALKIDGVLLSHLDEDHVGMLPLLSTLIPISCIETNSLLWKSKKGKKLSTKINALSPSAVLLNQNCMQDVEHTWLGSGKHGKGNELMAGSYVRLNQHAIYVGAGDADFVQEEQFLQWLKKEDLNAARTILKAGHHGSKYSSSDHFLKELKPTEAWVSVGRKNRYGHPHPATLFRFTDLQIPIYRTDIAGSLRSKALQPDLEKISL